MSKVGLPGADLGLRKEDPTIAELLKPLGYMTGQFQSCSAQLLPIADEDTS
jgi:arylsulfatase A-like enzyme